MLTRWNDLDRLFQRFENDWMIGAPWAGATFGAALDAYQPQFQLHDDGDAVCVFAEVPGLQPQDLKVSFEQGTLSVQGERRDEVPEGYTAQRQERGALRFSRAFKLSARIDPDKIEASLKNGLLELRLPKAPEDRPRTITVNAA